MTHVPTTPDAPQTMTIGELSSITGLSASAIRFYQRRGLVAERDTTGWQRFDHTDLGRLAIIELAKSAGFSLDEIIRLFDALSTDPDTVPADTPIWQGLAAVKLDEIETRIHRLQHLHHLLSDALACSYLSADRVADAPAAMGWVEHDGTTHPSRDAAISVPDTAEGIHQTPSTPISG